MERHAKGLKRKLNIRMAQTKAASRARLAENSALIKYVIAPPLLLLPHGVSLTTCVCGFSECNQLRKDNVTFRRKIKELETQVYLLNRDAAPQDGQSTAGSVRDGTPGGRSGRRDTAGSGSRKGSRSSVNEGLSRTAPVHGSAPTGMRGSASAAALSSTGMPRQQRGDPGNNALMNLVNNPGVGRSASAAQFDGSRSRRRTPRAGKSGKGRGFGSRPGSSGSTSGLSASGRIVRGTTKNMEELTSVRVKMGELLGQLDDNNREMAMQRREIKRLREQVRVLATRGASPTQSFPGAPPGPGRPTAFRPGAHQLPPAGTRIDLAGSMGVGGMPVSPVGTPRSLAPLGTDGGMRDNDDESKQGHGASGPLSSEA